MESSSNKVGFERIPGWLVFAGIFAAAMSFALYTSHIWEDFFITYRVSKNLATGHGLVYTIGEHVQAFTSPFNVLIPAVLSIITGNTSDELVLWLFRILSCLLLGIAGVLLFKTARKNSLTLIPTALLIGMFGMDAKILDFSINGQEIAFMMVFLALTLNALMVQSRHTILKLGLAWAGLMWTRPDGFIYIAAICLGFLLFNAGRKIAESRLGLLKIFIYAGAIAGALYLPWFLWAWYYYGSPIPHTIIAKGYVHYAFSPNSYGDLLVHFLTFPLIILFGDKPICTTFLPTYFAFGGWHYTVLVYSRYLTCICALYWCLPFGRSQARAVSFAYMICLFYITDIASSAPWYVPSCTFLAIFVFAYFIQQSLNLVSMLKDKNEKLFRSSIKLVHAMTISALAGTLLITLCSAYQLRIRQREIENESRKKIGLWLRQNATSPADTVFLEPLGYIGFYSQLKMLDYPGLCAPEVVAALKKLQSNIGGAQLIQELHPDWLVLRPWETEEIQKVNPLLLTQSYSEVMVFDATERILSYHFLPGRGYLLYDRTFFVFKLNKNKTLEELKKP